MKRFMTKVPTNVKIEKNPMGNYLIIFSCNKSGESYSFMLDPKSAWKFAEALMDDSKKGLDVKLNKLN